MTSRLHTDKTGAGPPLVMIHGWGLHGGVWQDIVPDLADRHRVLRLDLPGHGSSPAGDGILSLDTMADAVAAHAPEGSTLVAWSLGGMVALNLAVRHPSCVGSLALVATTPRFVAGRDWPCGLDAEIVDGFGESLRRDYKRTVRRFLTLQVRGDEKAAELLVRLRQEVFARGEPDADALAAGLSILRKTDVRADLRRISQPTLVIAGERDTLVPAEAGRRMAAAIPGASFALVAGASHAPFLSHREAFLSVLAPFVTGNGQVEHAP